MCGRQTVVVVVSAISRQDYIKTRELLASFVCKRAHLKIGTVATECTTRGFS